MKVILRCSSQYINTIKRRMNAQFDEIEYRESYDNDSLLIKEVRTLKDIDEIEKIKNNNIELVCLINNGEYMFELLEFKPLAFIRTQCLNEDLEELIHRILYKKQGLDVMIDFQCGYQKIRLCVDQITYIESYAHYLLIHTPTTTVKVREKISDALKKLQDYGFIQVHRSYLVNKNYVKQIGIEDIIMNDSYIIPVGKKYRQKIKNI